MSRAGCAVAVLVILVALALAAWLLVPWGPYPEPDFARVARPIGDAERAVALPTIVMVHDDIDAGNDLLCMFIDRRGASETAISLVFADEDHPLAIVDRVYDVIRWYKYGRVMDVETILLRHAPGDPGAIEAIELPGVFAGDQPFDVWIARHHSTTLRRGDAPENRWSGGPFLYVATWNHLFAPPPRGARLDAESLAQAGRSANSPRGGTFSGSREEVEAIFRAVREGH